MKTGLFVFFLLLLALETRVGCTTLPPELKAYDFAEAYYLEDGGVVISPYGHGFSCSGGISTPEGIRIMPGGTFIQYNSDRMVCEVYHFVRLEPARAFFHEQLYRYCVPNDSRERPRFLRENLLGVQDFYLTEFRGLEWFDHAFPHLELHPGLQEWRSK